MSKVMAVAMEETSVPQRLKPLSFGRVCGTAEAVPLNTTEFTKDDTAVVGFEENRRSFDYVCRGQAARDFAHDDTSLVSLDGILLVSKEESRFSSARRMIRVVDATEAQPAAEVIA